MYFIAYELFSPKQNKKNMYILGCDISSKNAGFYLLPSQNNQIMAIGIEDAKNAQCICSHLSKDKRNKKSELNLSRLAPKNLRNSVLNSSRFFPLRINSSQLTFQVDGYGVGKRVPIIDKIIKNETGKLPNMQTLYHVK